MTLKQAKFRQELEERWECDISEEFKKDIKETTISATIMTMTKTVDKELVKRISKVICMLHDAGLPRGKATAWLGGYLWGISERIGHICVDDLDTIYNLFECGEI